jgi:hypothetical protein
LVSCTVCQGLEHGDGSARQSRCESCLWAALVARSWSWPLTWERWKGARAASRSREDARIVSGCDCSRLQRICGLHHMSTRRMLSFPLALQAKHGDPSSAAGFWQEDRGHVALKARYRPIAQTQPRCPLLSSLGMRDCGPLLRALRIVDGLDSLAGGCAGLC